MNIGIPKEIKVGETRVAVSPQGVRSLKAKGHVILVGPGAGRGSGWSDAEYRRAGATLVRDRSRIYRQSAIICKVKEPQPDEVALLGPGQVVFTFLHLAGNPTLAKTLCRRKVIAIGYETMANEAGALPILAPMSEVAGRVAALLGAHYLRSDSGGKGILLSRVGDRAAGVVGVIGCGHVGRAAIDVAVGLGARVIAVDRNPLVLKSLTKRFGRRVQDRRSNARALLAIVKQCDLLIGAVLVPGRRAPRVITTKMVRAMQEGSVIVDVAIDQGGCVETMRATSIEAPVFKKYGVLHCAIPNLPALAPRTASSLLAEKVEPYLLMLANHGWEKATAKSKVLARGLNVVDGKIVYPGLL